MRVGYARVSSPGQTLDRQIGALRAERCEFIFREKASGQSLDGRPQLEKAIDALGTGDVLIVAEWDRATRSMLDGIQIIARIAARLIESLVAKPPLTMRKLIDEATRCRWFNSNQAANLS